MGSSLIVCIARDPGPVKTLEEIEAGEAEARANVQHPTDTNDDSGEMTMTEALLSGNEISGEAFSLAPVKHNGESRWCRKVSNMLFLQRCFTQILP